MVYFYFLDYTILSCRWIKSSDPHGKYATGVPYVNDLLLNYILLNA